MDKFTASNGTKVRISTYPGFKAMTVTTRDHVLNLGGVDVDALREVFRAERDEELGRWRWSENPDYVVYPDEDGDGIVLNERDGMSGVGQTRATVDRYPNSFGADAARAYFEAHPERKPWHDAKPGDVWVFEVEGVESIIGHAIAALFGTRIVTPCGSDINLDSSVITGGRRIWPEDAS